MILRIEELKEACSNILGAVDSNSIAAITETLELKTVSNLLLVSVTNKEYYAQVKIPISEEIEFKATVNANIFLRLISQTTSETIELDVTEDSLCIKGNGIYKLPLIFDGDHLLELPEIQINNITSTFSISTNILHSLITFNSKELGKGGISKPVQKMYYLDDRGCITFTSGACVNNFSLSNPIKILLNDRLVKLFKLFKNDSVIFSLGYDEISEEIIQTKVKFEDKDISITAILSCDDSLISSVPVTAIRNRASENYPYSVVLNKNQMLEGIIRLLLFANNKEGKLYSDFEFGKEYVKIWDVNKSSFETIYYENSLPNMNSSYNNILDLVDLKTTLESCLEQYINLSFGDEQAIVISRKNVQNIIPECRIE